MEHPDGLRLSGRNAPARGHFVLLLQKTDYYLLYMANLLNYTSARSPLQNAVLALIVVMVAMLLVGAVPTQ